MKLKLYRSSTVGIIFENCKILTDPWLVDGEYYGSWSHYPPFNIENSLTELNSYDAIYVSHIHPDHCSVKTMSYFNKDIPIIIHKFHSRFLKFKIEKMGFKNVIEVENGKKHQINKDTSITIFAADNCDPELCYKFTGCANLNDKNTSQQIDTLSVIQHKNLKIVNVNDCPYDLAKHPLKIIKDRYKNIDILMTGYGGAGPYPQCFENLEYSEKIIESEKKKKSFLDQAFNFTQLIEPNYYLPFAGTYTLTGKLFNKQEIRGVPEVKEACNYIDQKLRDNNIKSKPIKIGPDDTFDMDKPEEIGTNFEINNEQHKKYAIEYLYNKKLDYEIDDLPEEQELLQLAKTAQQNFIKKKEDLFSDITTDILIDFGNKIILLPSDNSSVEIKNIDYTPNKDFIKLKLDPRLLKRILMGPRYAHWNNAEIGSHIEYYRQPNIFNRNLHLSICYFHN
jgi:UDP-MurNAc hydroxylase